MVAYTNTTPESIAQKASVMADHLQVQQQQQQQQLELPPGFRFHPTDEEIITFYLVPKVLNPAFVATAIGEVDLNKNEPWELPKKAKMGEKEWYFYCQKDRKYPTGIRTNRATDAGYWKATGKDKEIFHPQPPSTLIGMKKTLVFYKGRAPRGEKTNWVMHEYRLEIGKQPASGTPTDISNAAAINVSSKEEYVVCRIFHKSTGLKKVVMPSYAMPLSMGAEHQHAFVDSGALPPLMDCGASSSQHAASLYQLQAGAPGSSMMGNMSLPMINGHYFGNQHQMMAAPPQPPMPFYHQQQQMMQMQMGADPSFMVGVQPGSGPSSMVSQEEAVTRMSNNDQANGTSSMSGEISSVNMGMDGMWKY